MFENFKKLKIKGGCFENETELELFKKYPLSVVYGRNGSGKTTIAHCIGELLKSDEEKSADYCVSSETIIADDKKQSVFIFDEDFVRDQVRVEKEGINTIVMLGDQVELDEQIANKKGELKIKEDELKRLDEERKKYDNSGESVSPYYYFDKIRESLRVDGGWADIDRDVKGNTLKSRITDEVINTLLGMEEPKESYEKLREQVMADLNLYLQSENAQILVWTREPLLLAKTLEDLNKLLTKPLDAPVLSDREQRLVTLLAMHPQHSIQETRQMLEEGWPFCPLCLREVKETDKETITQTLTHILNKEADRYEALLGIELKSFSDIETTLPTFSGRLNEKELNAAQTARTNLNSVLKVVRDKICQRKRNIYETLKNPFDKEVCKAYEEALADWINSLDVIQQCVVLFNDSVSKRARLFNQVRAENNQLARKQLAALLQGYRQAIVDSNQNRTDLEAKGKECEDIRVEINALQQKKENTNIALGYINKELQYVFYSNHKVKLESGDGCYKLKVNDRNVSPKKISVGERNVLGLCYFFAKLFGGKTDANKYCSESLLVIDDPVSSFDYGNRVGVMSLLRFQFGNILKGNNNSRILVMSHDLHSVFDLVKIRNEVVQNCTNQSFMELMNNKLEVKRVQNEYYKLLEYVFCYASNTDGDVDETLEMSIGNVMRRMMEAFSSFCYNAKFEKMVRNEEVLALIPKEKRSYYENFMGRLTLNAESHMAESIYTLDSVTACFTKDEKIQTAKSVLLFLLYINKPHLAAYLNDAQISTIEGWKTEEIGWLVE
jgi:wobble nucleotide-excising tRNase